MTKQKLLEKLQALYTVLIRTNYHVQIEVQDGYHNIWFNKRGQIRCQLYGQDMAYWCGAKELLEWLKKYDYAKTDLAYMQSLSKLISEVSGKKGIFVDAGWKAGQTRMAVIRSYGDGDMDITVRCSKAATNIEAEIAVIKLAMNLYCEPVPIYSDCKTVCDQFERAVWIPRKQNKEADHLGNMRGVDIGPGPYFGPVNLPTAKDIADGDPDDLPF